MWVVRQGGGGAAGCPGPRAAELGRSAAWERRRYQPSNAYVRDVRIRRDARSGDGLRRRARAPGRPDSGVPAHNVKVRDRHRRPPVPGYAPRRARALSAHAAPRTVRAGDDVTSVGWTCPGLVDTWVKLPPRPVRAVARTLAD